MSVEEMLAARAKFEEECTELCPRCNQMKLHPTQVMNALCRRDNKTYICSPCGRQQAMNDLKAYFAQGNA